MTKDNHNERSGHISRGSVLFRQNDNVHSIALVLKGKVMIQNECIRSVVSAGCFLGVYDLMSGSYQADYIAVEDLTLMYFDVDSISDVVSLCENKAGYGGWLVSYFCQRIRTLNNIFEQLAQEITALDMCVVQLYSEYVTWCNQHYITPNKLDDIEAFGAEEEARLMFADEIDYYLAVADVNKDVQKAYFGADSRILMHHLSEQQMLIDNLYHECENAVCKLDRRVRILAVDTVNLFGCVKDVIIELQKSGSDVAIWIEKLNYMMQMTQDIEELYSKYIGRTSGIDDDKLKKLYASVTETDNKQGMDLMISQLDDSLDNIISYSGISANEGNTFKIAIEQFAKESDKYSTDKEVIKIRSVINRCFYNIYYNVFVRAVKDNNIPIYIKLFLDYGYVSEKLLSEEQLQDLILLSDTASKEGQEPCKVYTLYQWLCLICSGKKEPSKSEFDIDYEEDIRAQIKEKRITEKEAAVLRSDIDRKLRYEIDNLFRSVNKLLGVKVTTFVPILYGEQCITRLYQSRMSAGRINSAVKKVLDIDYSVFAREVMYANNSVGIVKDYIIKEVYPDIILFPCYGVNGIMWQDISGKKRDSKGRFIFPILFDGDEYATIIGVLGRFRWELCKTVQGVKWNDIHDKSLTSEYLDYIQFYRKNAALSEEWKEKLSRQIKNCRNNIREIFVKDYIEWIRRESAGGMRISKVSRDILATYCPFTKDIRQQLEQIPLYSAAMKRYNMMAVKKQREYESKCIHISRSGYEVPAEILMTKEFYCK